MKRIIYVVFMFLFLVSSVIITQPANTYATTSSCDEGFYSDSDILYYSACAEVCSPGGASVQTGGSSLPDATTKYLDGRGIKALVDQNKARYDKAQSVTGVPWQVTAALHYREAGMNPASSIYNGAPLGSGVNVDGQNVVADPLQDAVLATQHFVNMAKGVYGIDIVKSLSTMTTEQWGNAFLAYNRGYLYKQNGKTYDQSPYVMNGLDDAHMNMSWVGTPADPAVSGVDGNKAGALAVLQYLGGMTLTSTCSSSGAVAGDIVKTALNYTRDTPADNGMTDPSLAKQAYRDAMPQFNGQNAVYPQVTDCGRFVSTVYHASGADTSFPAVSVTVMVDYMNNSPKYQALGSPPLSELKPGDIMATSGHIIIYTGPNGPYMAADASFTERVPSVRTIGGPMWIESNGGHVWRLK